MPMRGPIAVIAALGALCLMPGAQAQMPEAGPQQQMPLCAEDFMPLRAEVEKRAIALKTAMEKKVTREEVCTLFKQFSAVEAKMVQYIEENASRCAIPAETAMQVMANHGRTLRTEDQICTGMRAKPKRLRMALNTDRSSAPSSTAFCTM